MAADHFKMPISLVLRELLRRQPIFEQSDGSLLSLQAMASEVGTISCHNFREREARKRGAEYQHQHERCEQQSFFEGHVSAAL